MTIEGQSKSGKTMTALKFAQHFCPGGIALIDTEHRTSECYGKEFAFDVCPLDHYSLTEGEEAIRAAREGGYGFLIIDSLSHFWSGEGGAVEAANARSKSAQNPFGGWREVTPEQNAFMRQILSYPGHVICTLRTSADWVINENERGKKVPEKVGTKAVQRQGTEYEFDITGRMNLDHEISFFETRCPAIDGQTYRRPGAEVASIIAEWLDIEMVNPDEEAAAVLLEEMRTAGVTEERIERARALKGRIKRETALEFQTLIQGTK